jgi:nicotinamide mononucleotide adenylyltransferase
LHISPKGALLRSALIPGWGQVYNHKPLKGLLFLSAESYFVYNFIHYYQLYSYLKETKNRIGVDVWVQMTESQKQDSIFSITGKEIGLNSWRPREIRINMPGGA